MKKLSYIIVLAVALVAGQALAVQVKQIALSYENGATVARVTADGPFQFRHQTEVPKDGKGDRMILDLIGVTTGLSAKSYANLPICGITAIRTGQYSVTPEKVVRVVFDVTKPPVYQVQQQGNTINVVFSDKAIGAFSNWNTDAVAGPAQPNVVSKPETAVAQAPVTAPSKVPTVEQDRLASLADEEPSAPQQASPVTTVPTAVPNKPTVFEAKPLATPSPQPSMPAPTTTVVAKPIQSETKSEPTATVAANPTQTAPITPLSKPVPVVTTGNQIQQAISAKPSSTPATDSKPTAVAPNTPAETVPLVKAPVTVETKPTTEVAKIDVTTPVTLNPTPVKPADTSAKPALASIPKPLTDDGNGQLAEADEIVTETNNPDLPANKSTSRFRRNAAADAKIKGTMVAEFPQRLVVKYETLGNRDPFATLIDDSRTYNTPVQNRVPNIDGLRLVGIIESERGATDNRALFEDKNGYSYILSSGDKVQRGYVLRVEDDRVYFQIFEYGWSRTVALAIENAN